MSVVVDGELTPVLSGALFKERSSDHCFSWSISTICHHKSPKVPASDYSQMTASCNGKSRMWTTKTILWQQQDLDCLHNWAVGWGMNFNPSKCYIMHITGGCRLDKFYQMCGTILGTVMQAMYLGITISDDLHWHQQTNPVAKKANTTLHMISRNLRYCPCKIQSSAYCTLVYPNGNTAQACGNPISSRI